MIGLRLPATLETQVPYDKSANNDSKSVNCHDTTLILLGKPSDRDKFLYPLLLKEVCFCSPFRPTEQLWNHYSKKCVHYMQIY